MRITYAPNASGSRYWRLEHPFKYLAREGYDIKISNGITDEEASNTDVFVLQNCVDKEGIALLYAYQQERGLKIVVDVDDFLEIDKHNPNKIQHERYNAFEVIKKTLEIADMVTTTTPYLKEYLDQFNKNVVVLPNYMDLEYWDGKVLRNNSDEIRIGYLGSTTHYDDIRLVRQTLIDILYEHKNVKLILVGDMRYRDLFKGYNVEVQLGVPFENYAQKLRGLRLDIGIAPLQEKKFNNYKSGIKVLEYGLCGVPVVASRTKYYSDVIDDGIDGYLAYRYIDWWSPLEALILDEEKRHKMGQRLREKVIKEYNLADKIYLWKNAYDGLNIQNNLDTAGNLYFDEE